VDPRGALNHPLRRQILRALIASDQPLSPSEIVATVPGASVSTISYHALVLESSGAVGRTKAGGASEDRYRAADPDPETIAILEATRAEDTSPEG
jgi:DNA-binding transcriptional ArsR family regulator